MAGPSTSRCQDLLRAMGPGIVFAGAAIGVSHLVQSTRAGASYGFALVWAILLVNLFKYPFFEFAQRYAAATGENVVAGYRKVGRWSLIVFGLISLGSGMPTVAAVTLVTAGLATQVFPEVWGVLTWSAILLAFCVTLLAVGGYPWLDRLMKLMMVFLAVCTAIAVVAAIAHGSSRAPDFSPPEVWNKVGIAFVIALMGWMPTPVDISVWPSLWMEERTKQTGHRPTVGEALFDFNLGYISTTVMAVLFLSLGALVMFGSGEAPAKGASAFAGQLVRLYTSALGAWSRPYIVMAAMTCMLSTTITVVDGYPRALAGCVKAYQQTGGEASRRVYWVFMVVVAGSAWLIIRYFMKPGNMQALVDVVTIVAFLSAPLLAFINLRLMSVKDVPGSARPPFWLRALSWLGLAFLVCFSVVYGVVRLS